MQLSSCPWGNWAPADVSSSCEALQCSLVVQPVNVITNLSFLVVSLLLFLRFKKNKLSIDRDFAGLALVVGLLSSLAHASTAEFFVALDYSSQFILFAYILNINSARIGTRGVIKNFTLVASFSTALIPLFFAQAVSLVALGILAGAMVVSELALNRTEVGVSYKSLWRGIGLFALGFIFTKFDSMQSFCNPNYWFQWHALWHIIGAASIFEAASYYRQFNKIQLRQSKDI